MSVPNKGENDQGHGGLGKHESSLGEISHSRHFVGPATRSGGEDAG